MSLFLETRYAMLTDVGRVRAHNEDACGADPEVGSYLVCDGMGGAAGGEVASRETAAAYLAEARLWQTGDITAVRLERAVARANSTVYGISRRDTRLRGMGTTLVALQTAHDRASVWITHVGDSRCYRVREGTIDRLTADHSVVEEQVRHGQITEAEARRSHLRNVITRVVGTQSHVEPELAQHACQQGDLFLLCTDGLNRDLSDMDILGIVERHRGDLNQAARMLIDAANLLGGGDNTTVLLVEIVRCDVPTLAGADQGEERLAQRSPLPSEEADPGNLADRTLRHSRHHPHLNTDIGRTE